MAVNDFIQVLWVENDPLITDSYPRDAEEYELELKVFPCWEEAEIALEKEYQRWQAIILDAKCKYKKDDADKADKFLTHVFARIAKIAKRKNHTIPWYVLSGQGEDDIRDLIPDVNEWDESWFQLANRRFYSKNGKIKYGNKEEYERLLLFERIRTHVVHYNQEIQIENDLYPDVFHALDNLGLAGDVGYYLMPLLIPIHFKGISSSDYNRRYIDLRKSLELIFRDMVKLCILPPNIVSKGVKEQVNLSWSSLFLGAEQPEDPSKSKESDKKFWEKIERLTPTPILPKQLANWLKDAVFQTGGAAHTSEAEKEIAMNIDKYLPNVCGSPYMLRSLTLGFCDFILWYDNFVKTHSDREMNALHFWKFRSEKY